MRVYIAGPMTGYPHFNFPSFDSAKKVLNHRFKEAEVFSPADNDRTLLGKSKTWLPEMKDHDGNWKYWIIPDAPDLRTMLGQDLEWIARNATAIYMLRNWENSKGAKAEWALAHALGLQIMYE